MASKNVSKEEVQGLARQIAEVLQRWSQDDQSQGEPEEEVSSGGEGSKGASSSSGKQVCPHLMCSFLHYVCEITTDLLLYLFPFSS